jgi:hypothetical protein
MELSVEREKIKRLEDELAHRSKSAEIQMLRMQKFS